MSSGLSLSGVHRSFQQGAAYLHVLRGLNLNVARGEVVALQMPEGFGG